jgi:hypothetical protein
MEPQEFLSSTDAARVLHLTAGAVRLLHRRGELPLAGKTVGGIALFRRADVERLAAQRKARRASGGKA